MRDGLGGAAVAAAVVVAALTSCSDASDAMALRGVGAEPPTPGLETSLVVEPAVAAAGSIVAVVPWEGALAPSSMQGPEATLDHEQAGEWRTLYLLLTEDLATTDGVPHAFAAVPGVTTTVPGIGYGPDQVLRFVLPPSLARGAYRLCKSFTGQGRACGDVQVT